VGTEENETGVVKHYIDTVLKVRGFSVYASSLKDL
jgi:hypothetical protein